MRIDLDVIHKQNLLVQKLLFMYLCAYSCLKDWTELRNYSELLKRTAEDRTIWNALARQFST